MRRKQHAALYSTGTSAKEREWYEAVCFLQANVLAKEEV
jgi:hypothetical protein